MLGVSGGLSSTSHPEDQSWAVPGCIPCQSKAHIFQQEQSELWDAAWAASEAGQGPREMEVTSKDQARKDKHEQRERDGTGWSIPSRSHLQERGSYALLPYPTHLLYFQGKR